jgi:hypothetical protein
MDRADFQRLAVVRLDEALALHATGHFSGSYYLGGYAVECALKACIAKSIRAEEWPEKGFSQKLYTHELPALLKLAGLDDGQGHPLGGDPALEVNWSTVKDWTEQARYLETIDVEARDLLNAIDDAQHGVLQWLKQHW